MTAAAPVQVGIFTNDLCISFRIVMHEILDSHVFRIFDAAKEIHQGRTTDNFRTMYERGMKTVNAWDTQMKERFRAQIIAQYRQLTDLYHHIFLMYVQEMYDQSLDDVTVRVNIPALVTMLHMFLRIACNHHVILSGEYVSTMNFAGRVLFVETVIRRLLYELLVQQNNIKSISTTTPNRRPAAPNANPKAFSVHSEEDVVSADMMVGTPRQAVPRRLSPTKNESGDADRFWMAPTAVSSNNSLMAVLGPAYNTPPPPARPSPTKLADLIPPMGTTSPSRTSDPLPVVVVNSPMNSPMNSQTTSQPNSQTTSQQNSQSTSQQNSQSNSQIGNNAPQPIRNPILPPMNKTPMDKTPMSPINSQISAASQLSVSAVMPASPQATVLTGIPAAAAEALVPKNTPRITSLPNQPVISGTQVSVEKPPEPAAPLFELKSQFTPFKPGGTALPDASVSAANRKDIDVDSLQLQPSDQDFAEEARLLLQNNNDTLTPFDSVTNIANGDRRPPLFFDTVRAV